MRYFIATIVIAFSALHTSADGAVRRSKAALRNFVKIEACPSTGEHRLPCPGYIIDHIKALACGGADDPGNLQWQTIAEAKAKDRWELDECGKGHKIRGVYFEIHMVLTTD